MQPASFREYYDPLLLLWLECARQPGKTLLKKAPAVHPNNDVARFHTPYRGLGFSPPLDEARLRNPHNSSIPFNGTSALGSSSSCRKHALTLLG